MAFKYTDYMEITVYIRIPYIYTAYTASQNVYRTALVIWYPRIGGLCGIQVYLDNKSERSVAKKFSEFNKIRA